MSDLPRCAACKRQLKRPSPSGLGPVCERRLNGLPAPVLRIAGPITGQVPGQTELPLEPLQVTLWSL